MNGRELDMKERWIHEGWFHQEGELLLHIRDRQDERQLLGGKSRVIIVTDSRVRLLTYVPCDQNWWD